MAPDFIDRLEARPLGPEPPAKKPPQPRYIAAKIPLAWVVAAHRASGGIVAWALWFYYGLARKRPFRASLASLTLGCVSIDAARRSLASLERAGLVQIEQLPGSRSIITLIGPGITTPSENTHEHP